MAFIRSDAASKVHQENPKPSYAPATDAGASGAGYVRLPHTVIVRAPGLLPMLYRPSELAVELDVTTCTVRDWLEKGLPHQRDQRGHLWIDGRQVTEWVQALRQQAHRPRMSADEAYCFCCRRAVELRDPVAQQHGNQVLLSGSCPHCGSTINRGSRNG